MNKTIELSKNDRVVRVENRYGISIASFDVTGWDEVKPLRGKVLVVDGVAHAYTGWDSDKNEIYFKTGMKIGTLATEEKPSTRREMLDAAAQVLENNDVDSVKIETSFGLVEVSRCGTVKLIS
jgi:hypothetical protein